MASVYSPVRTAEPPEPERSTDGVRLLVADGCVATRRTIDSFARRHAASVTQARDGRVARDLAAGAPFDMMPVDLGLGGLDALVEFRTEDASAMLIGLATEAGTAERRLGRALRGYDLMLKPVTEEALERGLRARASLAERLRVLIVDDSAAVRRVVQKVLTRSSFRTEPDEAESGEAALDRVRERGFDLVVLDLNMPGLDGAATLERLKATAPEIRVILISSEDEAAVRRRVAPDLWDAFLRKPFFPETFDACLRGFLAVPEPVYL